MDKLSPEQRHRNMAAIHGKDTKPEMIVRRGLWSRLQDHGAKTFTYPKIEEESSLHIAAEEREI